MIIFPARGHTTLREEKKNSLAEAFSLVATIGFTMVSCVAVGLGMGYFVDQAMHSSPWSTIVGIIIGMISGLWSIFRILTKISKTG